MLLNVTLIGSKEKIGTQYSEFMSAKVEIYSQKLFSIAFLCTEMETGRAGALPLKGLFCLCHILQ